MTYRHTPALSVSIPEPREASVGKRARNHTSTETPSFDVVVRREMSMGRPETALPGCGAVEVALLVAFAEAPEET